MNDDGRPRCECLGVTSGRQCASAAAWRVMVGTRHSDAQLSCRLHLNRTCQLMAEAEYPRLDVPLTVTRATRQAARAYDVPRKGLKSIDDVRAMEGLL